MKSKGHTNRFKAFCKSETMDAFLHACIDYFLVFFKLIEEKEKAKMMIALLAAQQAGLVMVYVTHLVKPKPVKTMLVTAIMQAEMKARAQKVKVKATRTNVLLDAQTPGSVIIGVMKHALMTHASKMLEIVTTMAEVVEKKAAKSVHQDAQPIGLEMGYVIQHAKQTPVSKTMEIVIIPIVAVMTVHLDALPTGSGITTVIKHVSLKPANRMLEIAIQPHSLPSPFV